MLPLACIEFAVLADKDVLRSLEGRLVAADALQAQLEGSLKSRISQAMMAIEQGTPDLSNVVLIAGIMLFVSSLPILQ